MSAFYDRMRETADRLLSRYGAPAVLVSLSAVPAIGSRPWDPRAAAGSAPELPARHPCRAVRVSYSERDFDGVRVLRGDVRIVLSGLVGAKPAVGDSVEFAGATYAVIDPGPVSPDGEAVVYRIQGRS